MGATPEAASAWGLVPGSKNARCNVVIPGLEQDCGKVPGVFLGGTGPIDGLALCVGQGHGGLTCHSLSPR
jgi:hypothetical protein